VRIKNKAAIKNRFTLAQGQVWKTKDSHVEIVQLGKLLVHYRMLKGLKQTRRTQISRVDAVEDYLKTNQAKLVGGISRN
jgi:hypothetical protein